MIFFSPDFIVLSLKHIIGKWEFFIELLALELILSLSPTSHM